MDKSREGLIAVLRSAAAAVDPLPLFKAGKQPGLFPSKAPANTEIAVKALADGLLERVSGEPGAELVRITPRGVQFLYEHESPKAVLEELVGVLRLHHDQLPRWHDELRAQLHALAHRFSEFLDRQSAQFEQLLQRAEAALRRLAAPPSGDPLPLWQLDALHYLDVRRMAGRAGDCPLAELFQAIRPSHPHLSLREFHEGLLALQVRRALELVPFAGSVEQVAEPEHALVDGAAVYLAVRRDR